MAKVSKLAKRLLEEPSPIREIMKIAERQNIVAMGLDPDKVISFGGGWVAHEAPAKYRQKYFEICKLRKTFHLSGAYSTTIGDFECRYMLTQFEAKLFGLKKLSPGNVIIGQSSTQLTHDLMTTLLDPNDTVILFDPTYPNYIGQIKFAVPTARILRVKVFDEKEWLYMPDIDGLLADIEQRMKKSKPKLLLFCSPDNPTSQVLPEKFVAEVLKICEAQDCFVAIDFAYKTICFAEQPAYFKYSPVDFPHLITIHSNSKWCRGLGRRLGWLEASEEVINCMERVQQSTILCPDKIHQTALELYLKTAIPDGSLLKYIKNTTKLYEKAAETTAKSIEKYLGFQYLKSQGGLYTVMNVNTDGDKFTMDTLKNTGVLFVPGSGFGKTLKNAVRVSYGPLVNALDKIEEGMRKVGEYLQKKG